MKIKFNDILFTEDSRFYICKYGLFYEGQILKSTREDYQVIIDKFIVHYSSDKKPELHIRCKFFNKKETFTMPCSSLGDSYIASKY